MTKKPSYRFVGYTEPWEQRKLGECTEISAGGDIEKSKLLNNGKYPVIANALTSDGIVGYYNDIYRIEAPAVTVTGRGDVGVAKARNVNFTPVVRLLSLKSEHDVIFLENAINTQKIVIESTGVPQLTAPQLGRYNIFFPSLPEQTAIGSFFQDIDHLITLQQRKLEVLKEQKKTYLKLLFPAKGQTKPALRFAGFEDEWKEVKLGEIIQSISSKNYITEYYEEGNNPVIQQGDIPIVGFSDNKPFNNFSNVILFGDHTLSLFKPETPFLLATDGIKILHSDLTTQPFLFIMLERYLPKSQGYKRHYSLLKNELSSLPSLPEQEVIGSFFQDLDKAIAKQEEKVNQLKESKQTLLRKMFI